MKKETALWLEFAAENLLAAKILLESSLYNPSLQNAQQAIEKSLKALCQEAGLPLRKTHHIRTLRHMLGERSITIEIEEEDLDLIDSIYLPSKYPLGSVLPHFQPDSEITLHCIHIAESVLRQVQARLG